MGSIFLYSVSLIGRVGLALNIMSRQGSYTFTIESNQITFACKLDFSLDGYWMSLVAPSG